MTRADDGEDGRGGRRAPLNAGPTWAEAVDQILARATRTLTARQIAEPFQGGKQNFY